MFTIFAFTATADLKPRSGDALSTALTGQVYAADLKEGFHFNEKAPNTLQIEGQAIKPQLFSARRLEFVGLPKDLTAGKAYLYICDDAITFCEPRILELKAGTTSAPKVQGIKKRGAINKYGFIEDDFGAAVALAKEKKQLLLLDFSARWCPGCMRLESEIFPKTEFKALTKDMVKVKIDTDRFENSVLGERFKIQGIPTLLVLNLNQEEVDRIYDYQPMAVLEKFFLAAKADPSSIQDLQARAASNKDPQASLLLGRRLMMAGQLEASINYLKVMKPEPPELLTAQVNLAEGKFKKDPSTKAAFVSALKGAIEAEPAGSRSLVWRTELIGLTEDKSEAGKIMNAGVSLAESFLKDPAARTGAMKNDLVGEFTGFEPLMIALAKVDLLNAGGAPPDTVKQAWAEAAKVGNELKITAKTPGPATRYLGTLVKSGQFDEANRLSNDLLKQDPDNGEVQRRRLRVLIAQKKYGEAIKLGETCLTKSYGRNEFWVAEALAEAYLGAEKKTAASQLLDRYLSRSDIQWSNMQGSKKSMEEMRAKLN